MHHPDLARAERSDEEGHMNRILVTVMVVFLALPLSYASAAPPPQSGGTLGYGLRDAPDRLDPNLTGFRPAQIIYFQLFDTLIVRDNRDKSFKPWLATSWTLSPDGLAYTFKLRPGIMFHDGTAFDSAAVKFNFDRTHDPKLASRLGGIALGFYDHADIIGR
jgi:peptide/nickel transport system substrate-binding protein